MRRCGRCKSCWWMKTSIFAGYGRCYRHRDGDIPFKMTRVGDCCTEYANRKKENGSAGITLDEWISKNIK